MKKTNMKSTKKTTTKSTPRKVSKTSRKPTGKTTTTRTKSTSSKRTVGSLLIQESFKDSSVVSGFRWVASKSDTSIGNLTVTMKDGSRYLYRSTPKQVVQNWRRRESAGTFFVKYIKPMKSERV